MFNAENLSDCSSFDELFQNENEILKVLGYATINLPTFGEPSNLFKKIATNILDFLKFIETFETLNNYIDSYNNTDFKNMALSLKNAEENQKLLNNQDDQKIIFQIIANTLNITIEVYTLNSINELEKLVDTCTTRNDQKKRLKIFMNALQDYELLFSIQKFEAINLCKKIVTDCLDWVFYPEKTKIQERTVTLSSTQLMFISQILDKQQKHKKFQKIQDILYYDQLKPETEPEFKLECQKTMENNNLLSQPVIRANSTELVFGNKKPIKVHPQSSIEQIRKEIASYEQSAVENIVKENLEEEEEDDDSFSNNRSTQESRRFTAN